MTYKIYWGNILKNIRNANKLKQEDIAYLLDITRQSYSQMECGHTHPTPEQIAILSDLYDINLFEYVMNSLPEEYVREHQEFKAHLETPENPIKPEDMKTDIIKASGRGYHKK